MTGRGVMTVAGETRDVRPGDLIHIPPDAVHSLRPTGDEAIHCFCFAVGVKGAGPIDYTTH
jgi:mannose-6-phosphate isomerase-like protein (cupin superfamily)